MTEKIRKSEMFRIIELLFKAFFAKHEGLIEIRYINKESHKSFSKFFKINEFKEDMFKEIKRLNIQHHVFFGVNPRPLSEEKKQADIKNIVCLWADLDGKDFQDGKDEALQSIENFSPKPNIIVDSGNGYHCYWILKEPIINVDDGKRLSFKKVLSGVIKNLNADKQTVNIDRVMRLPGTFNIKGDPLECKIICVNEDKTYSLDDFNQFKDEEFTESKLDISNMPDFGEEELIVRNSSSEDASEDVKKLEIQPKYKKFIITGALKVYHDEYKSRSERDMAIICALISAKYNYATIRSIFFNQYLDCSDRILEKGEEKLKWDVLKGLDFVRLREPELSKEQQKILNIKLSKSLAEQKRIAINKFILQGLLLGEDSTGYGLRDKDRGIFYYFDSTQKWLIDVDVMDFYCFIRDRFGISKREKEEILDAIKTEIWVTGQEVTPHRLSYFDEKKFILYVSDHNNRIFKIDGEKIEHVDNGTDGVFFEFIPAFTPFEIDVNNLAGVNYFEQDILITKREMEKSLRLKIIKWPQNQKRPGFARHKFEDENCYLRQFLIDRTNFAHGDKNSLTIGEQKCLLLIYFFSLFFESIQQEKPIACFVGRKESGKSFIATSIGKILFGDSFQSGNIPDDLKDLGTILGENYFLVFDNLDHYMKHKMLDVICNTATGGEIERRKLYTDRDVVKIRPRVFLAITTREAKFKRDDLVSRLLLFYTRKINNPTSRTYLYKGIKENRDKIMAEILINLNSIVKLLKVFQNSIPDCISRIADWELFVRKVAPGITWVSIFRSIFEKLNAEKDKFNLEDDYLYLLLHRIVYLDKDPIQRKSALDLYNLLRIKAEEINMTEFWKAYTGAVSIGKRISHIKEELESAFDFKIRVGNHNVKYYTFETKTEETEEEQEETKEKIRHEVVRTIEGEQPFLFSGVIKEMFLCAKFKELTHKISNNEEPESILIEEDFIDLDSKIAAIRRKAFEKKAMDTFPDKDKKDVENTSSKEMGTDDSNKVEPDVAGKEVPVSVPRTKAKKRGVK